MLAVWLACVVVFLCLHVFTALLWGGGCGCVVGLGIKCFWRAGTLSGSRSTPCERLLPCCWVVVACAASQWLCVVGVGVCGGLFVLCIVVASVFVLYCFLCFV